MSVSGISNASESRWADGSAHLLLLTTATLIIAAGPALPLVAWVLVLALQTVFVWNMRRYIEHMLVVKKLVSTLPMILGTVWAAEIFPVRLAFESGDLWLASCLGFVSVAFVGLNLYRSLDFIRSPEMIGFLVPSVSPRLAWAEVTYIILAPIAEEMAFRHFPALIFDELWSYLVVSIVAFVASHYVNPWQSSKIGMARILEQVVMAVLLTAVYLSFGLVWSILIHFLYNLCARGFYVSYLIKHTHLS